MLRGGTERGGDGRWMRRGGRGVCRWRPIGSGGIERGKKDGELEDDGEEELGAGAGAGTRTQRSGQSRKG